MIKKVLSIVLVISMFALNVPIAFAAEGEQIGNEEYIEKLLDSIKNQDVEAIWNLLEDSSISSHLGFSEYGDYKVLVSMVEKYYGDEYDNSKIHEVQIRPESGTGYYASVEYTYWGGMESGREDYIGLAVGQCENWNWNGEYTFTGWDFMKNEFPDKPGDTVIPEIKIGKEKTKSVINGTMTDGIPENVDNQLHPDGTSFLFPHIFGWLTLEEYVTTDIDGNERLNWSNLSIPQGTGEYIYDAPDPGEDIALPVWRLEEVIDADCTVKSIDTLLEEVPLEKLQTPTGTDLATLYAETAIMRAACKKVDGGDLTINAALLKIAESVAVEAQGRLAEKLESVGIPPAREISKTVTLTTDETSLDIRIDPDVLGTQVDKIRVETPTYALTFKLEDLQDDLTGVLQFRAEDTGAGFAPSRTTKKPGTKTVVKIDLPKPKMSNPVTVSMPKQTGETVHQAVVSTDGQATASKYNPASDLMDGKVNTSGSYTVKSNEKDFSDIANKSQEMQKAIRYLASKGIINGTTETAFSPDGSINRAEIATLIVKALGKLDPTAVSGFTDVPAGSWYAAAAASSQRQGYIQGFEDHTFRGPTVINKVQIVSVSSRVLQKEMRYKASAAPAAILTKYSDTVDAWAQPDVALATRENLVLYRKDGTFSGRRNMTRGDAAIIIYRLFQRLW